MKYRTYHEVAGTDASDLASQVARQRERVTRRLASVGRVVGVMSGKGGVGKTWVTAGVAHGLARRGLRTGVLDADLAAPTAARLLGASGPLLVDTDEVVPADGHLGIRVFSSDLLLEEGAPLRWKGPEHERFVWRSTLEAGALREFLSDVAWGDLDVLLIDLPPGIDRLEDLAELVPGLEALAVTLPSQESERAVARSLRAARDAGVRLLGLVENMSGYGCPGCAAVGPLFPGRAGAALAAEFGTPLLAMLPFLPSGSPEDTVAFLQPVTDLLQDRGQ